MGKHAQIEPGRMVVNVFVATSRRGLSEPLRGQEWRKDLLTSWLFQTCIKLQTSLDRRFLRFGMTVQEANVLLRCVEARTVTPGKLAIALGRDKGKITRFVDRLESSRLLTRDIDQRDRRFSIPQQRENRSLGLWYLSSTAFEKTSSQEYGKAMSVGWARCWHSCTRMRSRLERNGAIGRDHGNEESERKIVLVTSKRFDWKRPVRQSLSYLPARLTFRIVKSMKRETRA